MFGSDLPSRQSNMPRCVCFSCQDVESHLLWKTYWNLIEKVQPRQLKLTKYVTFSEVQRCGLTSNRFVSNLVWMMRSSSIPWKSFLNLRRNHMRNSQSLMRIGWKVVKAKNVGENLLLRKSLFFFSGVLYFVFSSTSDILSGCAVMRRRLRITTLGHWSGQMQGVNMERLIPSSVWLFSSLLSCRPLYPLLALV